MGMTDTAPTRAEYTAGLRALADLLDATPDLPLPHEAKFTWGSHWMPGDTAKERLAALARLLPGRLTKNDPSAGEFARAYMTLTGRLHGIEIEAWADRDAVCQRVVTGTREVTKTIPVRTKEVTVTEDIVEWVCSPILEDAIA